MKRGIIIAFTFLLSLFMTGCFNEKNSPFYDSQWVMTNYDNNMDLYYHHLILEPGHKVMLRVSYADSTNIIVWTGTYKIDSRKFKFNFTDCVRYEDGQVTAKYTSGQFIKYYTGEFLYSVGLVQEDSGKENYHLQLIRPKNYFYGDGKDIFGNQFEEFVKFE